MYKSLRGQRVVVDWMSEEREPDLDEVRKAMREHDERVKEDEELPEEEPAERPDDEGDESS